MVMVAFYFSLIYFPLVIIFTCARVLLPGMEIHPDRVMPEMATVLTENAGVPWLAGLLVAAPFAAVMSSVDSFLLLVSSGVVRDIYQESINRNASEKQIKRLTYIVTVVVGLLGVFAVLHPPPFLQDLIVFASAGLGACFLMPMIFALFWPRTTPLAMAFGMVSGGLVILVFYWIGYLQTGDFNEYRLFDLHPFIWSVIASAGCLFFVSVLGRKLPDSLTERFFGKA
jgi:SSS family solute:Na+ symporter/sodium/pantothenate symporter